MDISTKGRYGVRALLDLAVNAVGGSVVTLASIADRQKISEGYLEQIISLLRKAGIVTGIKGPQGGYILARPAGQIKMKQALEALEGELFVIREDKVGLPEADMALYCIQQMLWQPMLDAISSANEAITLQDMIDTYVKIRESGDPMYYI